MSEKLKVGIVGASGYTGGELLRLLLGHPQAEVIQATSERHVGEYVYSMHPHLRKRTAMQFVSRQVLGPCDVLFLALPHGEAQKEIARYASLAGKIVDLSADFRLKDPALYKKWYGHDHLAPEWMGKFVYGLPEFHREAMRKADYISGVGCNATAANLALAPLVRNGLLDPARPVIVDVKVGSSEAGASPNAGSHHPERAGVIRTYAPSGHRHTAEVIQELGITDVHLTITSVDLVRGALAAAHMLRQIRRHREGFMAGIPRICQRGTLPADRQGKNRRAPGAGSENPGRQQLCGYRFRTRSGHGADRRDGCNRQFNEGRIRFSRPGDERDVRI